MQNPSFMYPDSGCYVVQQIVTSQHLCRDTTESLICILPDWAMYFPNAFTPNGDGINDVFIPVGTGIEPDSYEMWIFDRWGNLLFYTDDLAKGWDGKAKTTGGVCQLDTYVYKVKCTDTLNADHTYIGKISLVK
jgi:gliding motility-associated-like protein